MEMEEEEEFNQIISNNNIINNDNIINRLIDIIYSPSFSNISYSYSYDEEDDNYYIDNNREEEDILNTSFINDKKKYKTVYDNEEEEEQQLKIIKYIKETDNNNDNNDKCPIMSTFFEDGQDIIQLPCKHSFEPEAIKQWLKEEKAECPVCRYNQFKTKEIKIEEGEAVTEVVEATVPLATIPEQISFFTDIFIQYEEEYVDYL